MTSRDEALRALENKWHEDADAAMYGAGDLPDNAEGRLKTLLKKLQADTIDRCRYELAAILSARQEVAPVAFDRALVMQHAEFRACLYALVGIVEGVQAMGRKWVSGGQRLKDTPEWCAFYVMANAIRDGRLPLASPAQTSEARDAGDAEMFRWLCENARPWESDYEEPHALIRICRGEFQGGVGWFNIIGSESRVGVITLRDAVRAAMRQEAE